jgi:hypothetical protein
MSGRISLLFVRNPTILSDEYRELSQSNPRFPILLETLRHFSAQRHMRHRKQSILLKAQVIVVFTFLLASCTTPTAISTFCGSAATTLASAGPVLSDMEASCLREVDSRNGFATFKPPIRTDPGCTEIGNKADGAAAAAKILSDYFGALNSLASFGTTKVTTDAQNLLAKTGAAFGASSPAQTALGSIASFITSAATSGYQERQLEKDLTKTSEDVPIVVNALITIVQDDYVKRLLGSEDEKLTTRYKEYVNDKSPPEVLLTVDHMWKADEQALAAKRASAQSLISALQALSKGFTTLASNARQLRAQEIAGLLGPYVTQLQTLIPQIQKAF